MAALGWQLNLGFGATATGGVARVASRRMLVGLGLSVLLVLALGGCDVCF